MAETEARATIEQRIKARAAANSLIELGISMAMEEGLSEPELNRHFWKCVRETIDTLIGEPEPSPAAVSSFRPPLEIDVPLDDDEFPFGKYGPDKGDPRTYGEVPDSYYRWLSGEDWVEGRYPEVLAYIEEHNLDS